MEMEDGAAPAEQWWKLSCDEENGYIVASEVITRTHEIVGEKPC